jgi:general secretion pathway protein G
MVKKNKPNLSADLNVAPAASLRALPPDPLSLLPDPCPSGFTLLELLIVMTIIALLAAIAVPAYVANVRAAREAVLKEDLHTLRVAIDSYTVDKQKGPTSLDDVVTAGYVRALPKDPITNRTDSWVTTQCDALSSVDQTEPGICDVHSGAQQPATDGTTYNTW